MSAESLITTKEFLINQNIHTYYIFERKNLDQDLDKKSFAGFGTELPIPIPIPSRDLDWPKSGSKFTFRSRDWQKSGSGFNAELCYLPLCLRYSKYL